MLPGAGFQLLNDERVVVAEGVTGADGKLVLANLALNKTFRLVESAPPAGYNAAEPQDITLTAGDDTRHITLRITDTRTNTDSPAGSEQPNSPDRPNRPDHPGQPDKPGVSGGAVNPDGPFYSDAVHSDGLFYGGITDENPAPPVTSGGSSEERKDKDSPQTGDIGGWMLALFILSGAALAAMSVRLLPLKQRRGRKQDE